MRPQYTLCLTMSFSDCPSSPFDAWARHLPRPMALGSFAELPDRRELPGIGIPGSARTQPLRNTRAASGHCLEGRRVSPTMPSGTVVRGSAFDQATRMLLLAMVREVSRNRRSSRTTWLRKLSTSLRSLVFLA
jgi:hypothetical protein